MNKHKPAMKAVSVFRNNAPNTWIVRGDYWGSPVLADCGPEGEANARRLALCWNMHDELVGALRGFLHIFDNDEFKWTAERWLQIHRDEEIKKARAVLAKLERGEA